MAAYRILHGGSIREATNSHTCSLPAHSATHGLDHGVNTLVWAIARTLGPSATKPPKPRSCQSRVATMVPSATRRTHPPFYARGTSSSLSTGLAVWPAKLARPCLPPARCGLGAPSPTSPCLATPGSKCAHVLANDDALGVHGAEEALDMPQTHAGVEMGVPKTRHGLAEKCTRDIVGYPHGVNEDSVKRPLDLA